MGLSRKCYITPMFCYIACHTTVIYSMLYSMQEYMLCYITCTGNIRQPSRPHFSKTHLGSLYQICYTQHK